MTSLSSTKIPCLDFCKCLAKMDFEIKFWPQVVHVIFSSRVCFLFEDEEEEVDGFLGLGDSILSFLALILRPLGLPLLGDDGEGSNLRLRALIFSGGISRDPWSSLLASFLLRPLVVVVVALLAFGFLVVLKLGEIFRGVNCNMGILSFNLHDAQLWSLLAFFGVSFKVKGF